MGERSLRTALRGLHLASTAGTKYNRKCGEHLAAVHEQHEALPRRRREVLVALELRVLRHRGLDLLGTTPRRTRLSVSARGAVQEM